MDSHGYSGTHSTNTKVKTLHSSFKASLQSSALTSHPCRKRAALSTLYRGRSKVDRVLQFKTIQEIKQLRLKQDRNVNASQIGNPILPISPLPFLTYFQIIHLEHIQIIEVFQHKQCPSGETCWRRWFPYTPHCIISIILKYY